MSTISVRVALLALLKAVLSERWCVLCHTWRRRHHSLINSLISKDWQTILSGIYCNSVIACCATIRIYLMNNDVDYSNSLRIFSLSLVLIISSSSFVILYRNELYTTLTLISLPFYVIEITWTGCNLYRLLFVMCAWSVPPCIFTLVDSPVRNISRDSVVVSVIKVSFTHTWDVDEPAI